MKDNDSAKIEKLISISERALVFFVAAGISSMAIAILGGFSVGIIDNLLSPGGVEWIRIVFALSAFVGASSSFSYGLAVIMLIWLTVIEVRSKSLTLRFGISAFVGYGFVLLLVVGTGYALIWWGIKNMVCSGVTNIIK